MWTIKVLCGLRANFRQITHELKNHFVLINRNVHTVHTVYWRNTTSATWNTGSRTGAFPVAEPRCLQGGVFVDSEVTLAQENGNLRKRFPTSSILSVSTNFDWIFTFKDWQLFVQRDSLLYNYLTLQHIQFAEYIPFEFLRYMVKFF